MARIFISAAHKSSGKTTLAIGLCAALQSQGLRVQPFKKGPDYIDPMWLGRAAQRPCQNLDFHTMQREEILATYHQSTHGADIAVIEGNKGLYDGLDLDGSNSNAALAKLLHAPVILVIDARGMTRGIAPLILGYQNFDHDIQIAGVILNQLGGHRHEQKLRQVIEHYTQVKVLGAVQHDDELAMVERHLGLVPANEAPHVEKKIRLLANRIHAQTDLAEIIRIARNATPLIPSRDVTSNVTPLKNSVRLGIARDRAFGFYYAGDLAALTVAGAELVFFDTLNDTTLPPMDGLLIGGGFPETHMAELEKNSALRQAIRHAIEHGMPAYAECGGLMYLARRITWNDTSHEMVGVIPADIVMHRKPQGRGYVYLQATGHAPWPIQPLPTDKPVAAHEFHYSSLENLPAQTQFAYDVVRGSGIDGRHDGIVYKNLLASYSHLRHTQQSPWASQFVQFIRSCKQTRPKVNPT
jgi:cobyrinic acid a,c-diamide synthase